jgi:hypothetical protein
MSVLVGRHGLLLFDFGLRRWSDGSIDWYIMGLDRLILDSFGGLWRCFGNVADELGLWWNLLFASRDRLDCRCWNSEWRNFRKRGRGWGNRW